MGVGGQRNSPADLPPGKLAEDFIQEVNKYEALIKLAIPRDAGAKLIRHVNWG